MEPRRGRNPKPSIPMIALGGVGAVLGGVAIYIKMNSEDVFRDLNFIYKLVKNRRYLQNLAAQSWSLADLWDETVKKFSNKVGFVFIKDDDSSISYTFKEMDEMANRVANWAASQGIKPGDVVSVMIENRPELLATFFGLNKVHAVTSFINVNLKGKPLLHSFATSKASYFIVGAENIQNVVEARTDIDNHHFPEDEISNMKKDNWFSYGISMKGFTYLDPIIANQSPLLKFPLYAKRNPVDPACYIYTSGTTGLPKASVIRHIRFMTAATAFSQSFEIAPEDRIYGTLPLYHSAGLMIGVGSCMKTGATFIFRKKFSASRFWQDCTNFQATAIQYIGELCRYLVAQPPGPFDRKHSVRMAIGNGLRTDIWKQFQERFNIPKIAEFYASTEGNSSLINVLGEFGAVGFLPPLVKPLYPVQTIRFDVQKEEPIRDKNGFCIPCQDNEVGLLIGEIDESNFLKQFTGYTDKKATEKKILTNVYKKGDQWFSTGDLLRRDKRGLFFFVDRVGDTFRWKGENVSTSEVEKVINDIAGIKEANVYGVQVPNHDGRAGMCCMVVDNSKFDLKNFYDSVMKELPPYAAPLFLRLREEIEITSTFKHLKSTLVQEGFDPSKLKDALYFRDDKAKKYIPFTPELHREVCALKSAKL